MPLIRKGAGTPPTEGVAGVATRNLAAGTRDERWAAARALSGRADAVGALGKALATEQDPRVREAILTGLAHIDDAESAAVVLPLIRSEDAGVRTGAIDALRTMPRALEAHLDELLRDADADVRLLACDLARQLGGGAATRLLGDLLMRDPEANVCAAAIEVLAESGGPEASPALVHCAQRFSGVPFLVFSARVAIDRIKAQAPVDGR